MSFTKKQLLPGEILVILAHQHFMVLMRPILANIVVLAVLGPLSLMQSWYWCLLYLLPLAYLLWKIVERRNREYILTDHRVVKQEGVFSVSSFDASLDKINNIFHEQTFWGRIFRYGDVGLETASEQGTTVFSLIPDPVNFKNCIVRQREMYKSLADKQGTVSAREDIPRLIQDLASLRDRHIISDLEFEEKKRTLLGKI
jgi:uncharacterized membrane protein YdbT with pleckstrin-like domain